jgi:hypothetical protein
MKLILYIILCFGLVGCATQDRCIAKYPPTVETVEQTVIEYRDSLILGETVTKVLRYDSLIFVPSEVTTIIDSSGKVELSYFKNAYGDLVVNCEAKSQVIEKLRQTKTKEVIITKTAPPLPAEKFIPWYFKALLAVTCLLSIYTVVKLLKLFIPLIKFIKPI